MTEHRLPAERLHFAFDNSLPPVLQVESGDIVTIETWDASGHEVKRTWTHEDAANRKRKPGVGHALTGPIAMAGARAGQTLVIDVLEVAPAAWGYTSFSPGRGLLPDDFPKAYIRIWDLEDGRYARGMEGVLVPLAPFCGVMGVALAEPGAHSTIPPRRVGGNMDVRQLTAGSTLYLPIEVDGALFSVGDAHGAQGDGEVCITAVEMDSVTRLRFSLSDTPVREPELRLAGPPTVIAGAYHGCTAHDPDLLQSARNATRWMIEWLCREAHLCAEDAYVLCSVAAELRISQVVDAPNWTVTAFMPLAVLGH
ncbi:MAG: acetamidase/formamidase family protein [Chloroflexi bacterium]|nr:acetamidase/formamidase family protein [Chloroflexota bacterium]